MHPLLNFFITTFDVSKMHGINSKLRFVQIFLAKTPYSIKYSQKPHRQVIEIKQCTSI